MLCGQKLIAKHVLQSEQAKSNKSILLTSTGAYPCSSATLVQDGRRGTQRKDTRPLRSSYIHASRAKRGSCYTLYERRAHATWA